MQFGAFFHQTPLIFAKCQTEIFQVCAFFLCRGRGKRGGFDTPLPALVGDHFLPPCPWHSLTMTPPSCQLHFSCTQNAARSKVQCTYYGVSMTPPVSIVFSPYFRVSRTRKGKVFENLLGNKISHSFLTSISFHQPFPGWDLSSWLNQIAAPPPPF